MPKPISRRAHAFTNYSYTPLVASAPDLVEFTEEKAATTLCHVLSGTVPVSSLLTRAEWGPTPVMPYKAHLTIHTIGGMTALTAPWLFEFAKNRKARNTFLVMGIFGLIAGLLSQPDEMPEHPQPLLS
jgi:hypothetical protein